jgi:hypothetical protein
MRAVTPEVWNAADLRPGDFVVGVYGVIAHHWWSERFDVTGPVQLERSPDGTLIAVIPTDHGRRSYSADTPMSVYPGGTP